jgi:hypothetical protein
MGDTDQSTFTDTSWLTRVGIVGTKLYLILIMAALPSMASLGWIKIAALELNEVGDFLAGLFGPLAIFWIVLGFFQQGKELKNSVETLKLQARELAASVEQQKELVQVTREQLAHERDVLGLQQTERKQLAQPNFILQLRMIMISGPDTGKYRCKLVNSGAQVSEVKLQVYLNDDVVLEKNWAYFEKGREDDTLDLFSGNLTRRIERSLRADISYVDDFKEYWNVSYDLLPPATGKDWDTFGVRLRERYRLPDV